LTEVVVVVPMLKAPAALVLRPWPAATLISPAALTSKFV